MHGRLAHQNRPRLANRLAAKLAASRFLTTSLIIHIVIVFVLGGVVLFKSAQKGEAFVMTQQGSFLQDSGAAEELPEEAAADELVQPEAEMQEFEQAAAAAPVAQSVLSALSSAPASWTTSAPMDQISAGTTLAMARTLPGSSTDGLAGRKGSGAGSLGKSSSITFFGIRSECRRVAFLLDASGSMILQDKGGAEAYAELKKELVLLVDRLNPGTEFNVIMFGAGAADLFQPQAAPASETNRGALRKWLEPYMKEKAGLIRQTYSKTRFNATWGTTRLDIALTAAFEMQADSVFILTDGTPNVTGAPDAEALRKWETNREKNKALFEQYEKDVNDYKTKFQAEYQQALKKAEKLSSEVQGRTQESYHWQKFAPNFPKAPPGYHRPNEKLDAADFNAMLKHMQREIYAPSNLPMPAVNIIGYYVDNDAEDFLKGMTKGIPGQYRTFRK